MTSINLIRLGLGSRCLNSRILQNVRPMAARQYLHSSPQYELQTRPTHPTQPFNQLVNKIAKQPVTQLFKNQFRFYSTQLQNRPSTRSYSTATTPPPPPPPHDKNEKGKRILSRISRAFTFSLSSAIVVAATGVALLVVYLILSELFLPSGDTRTFNKAVKLVEKNETAQKLLSFNSGDRIKAYGEVPGDAWVRNRPVHSVRSKGQDGRDRLLMRFHVESDNGKHGSVTLEQVDTSFWSSEFAYIALDVAGSKRVYVVEPRFQSKSYVPKGGQGFLGVKWGPKKEN